MHLTSPSYTLMRQVWNGANIPSASSFLPCCGTGKACIVWYKDSTISASHPQRNHAKANRIGQQLPCNGSSKTPFIWAKCGQTDLSEWGKRSSSVPKRNGYAYQMHRLLLTVKPLKKSRNSLHTTRRMHCGITNIQGKNKGSCVQVSSSAVYARDECM